MKVYIGPYTTWVGPYQISNKLVWLIGERRSDKLGEWLASTWVSKFCEWLDKKKKRKILIHIDNYDVWGMDHTLALIIVPMLERLRDQKCSYPFVHDEDVPDNIKSTSAPPLTEEEKRSGQMDAFAEDRWNWVLNEMIWAFTQHTDDDWEAQFYSGEHDFRLEGNEFKIGPNDTFKVDREGMDYHRLRMENGRRLFARYYESLWD